MCRHAWQLLGMLGNILGRPRHALQCPRHARNILGVLGMHFCKVLGSLVVHYSLGFTAYKAASEGVFLRCGTPRTLQKCMSKTLQSMPRTLQSMPRTSEDVAKHA